MNTLTNYFDCINNEEWKKKKENGQTKVLREIGRKKRNHWNKYLSVNGNMFP